MGDLSRWALAAIALGLMLVTLGTMRRPGRLLSAGSEQMPDLLEHRRRWSELHGGFETASNGFVRHWLGVIHGLARRPASWGISPNVLSLWGVWCAGACAVTADLGR